MRFESKELASRNAERPEQGEWWQKMAACFDGDVTFHDCDDATMFLGGGSDDAGFVQVIQGRLSDPERFRTFMSQPMDALKDARPEILGGTIGIDADGTFTETVPSAARRKPARTSRTRCPRTCAMAFEAEMAQVQDMAYLDLHHPWFTSAGTGLDDGGRGGSRAVRRGRAETLCLPERLRPLARARRTGR